MAHAKLTPPHVEHAMTGQPVQLALAVRVQARHWLLALLAGLALCHGLAYALIVPAWQTPDEPLLYEYVALTALLGRIPTADDRDPALEARIVASLNRQQFWQYLNRPIPQLAPQTLAEAIQLFWMPRQVGGDPPLYFALTALPLGLVPGWPPEAHVRLLRLLQTLLLPLIVVCAYAAAGEVMRGGREDRRQETGDRRQEIGAGGHGDTETRRHGDTEAGATKIPVDLPISRSPGLPVSGLGSTNTLPLAVAALVAAQPMLAMVGASVSNDGLANLLGAALCWLVLRMVGRGVTLQRLALFGVLLVLGLLTKRTLLPYLFILLLLGLVGLAQLRLRYRLGMLGAGLALVGGLLLSQIDWGLAAGWNAPRTWQASNAILSLPAGTMAVQALPEAAGDGVRGKPLRAGARLWGNAPATGRLIMFTAAGQYEQPFVLDQAARTIAVEGAIPAWNGQIALGVVAQQGQIYADDLWVGSPAANLLNNGTLDLPGLRADSQLPAIAAYLRLPDVAWRIAHRGLFRQLVPGWWQTLFVSFWGHFGWMQVPFVAGSGWEPALLAVMAVSGVGLVYWWITKAQRPEDTPQLTTSEPQRTQRTQRQLLPSSVASVADLNRSMRVLLALAGAGVLLPLAGSFIGPVNLSLQQGRYLLPVLLPLALLLALGQLALLPRRWWAGWLMLWMAGWAVFAGSALLFLYGYY